MFRFDIESLALCRPGFLRGLARFDFDVQHGDFFTQLFQTTEPVLPLTPRLLTHDDDSGGLVQQTHRAVGFVDVLAALAGGAKGVEVALCKQVVVAFRKFDLGHDGEKMLYSFTPFVLT